MIVLMWLLPCLVTIGFLFLLPALWRREIRNRYSGSRPVTCPENQQSAVVGIDLDHAVEAEMDGIPDVRLCECSRWPDRAQCAQGCVAQAIQAQPYAAVAPQPGRKQIYHLPVFLAAFAAWCMGAIWHAQYAFRPRWIAAVGLTQERVHEFNSWYSLHLLTLAMCLLFAYGVAGLLALSHRKGVLAGVLTGAALCAALALVSWFGIAGMTHQLLEIEAGYAVLAALTAGGIVGGLYDKLVLPAE